MTREAEALELLRARRLSARAMPIYSVFMVIAVVGAWLAMRYFAVDRIACAIVVGFTAFPLVGDILNYFVCGWRLQRLRSGIGGLKIGVNRTAVIEKLQKERRGS